MSTYGLSIRNPSGQLTISSDARQLTFYGYAQYLSTVQVVGQINQGKPGRTGGYMKYRVSCPYPFILGIEMPLNTNVGIMNSTYGGTWGGGTYDIDVYAGSSADAYGFDTVQTPVNVYIFTMASLGGSPATPYGLALYNRSGQLTFDSSRTNMLFPRATFYTSGLSSVSIPSLSNPVIIGSPKRVRGSSWDNGSPTGDSRSYNEFRTMWRRTSSTNITATEVTWRWYVYFEEPPDYDNETQDAGNYCFLLGM